MLVHVAVHPPVATREQHLGRQVDKVGLVQHRRRPLRCPPPQPLLGSLVQPVGVLEQQGKQHFKGKH